MEMECCVVLNYVCVRVPSDSLKDEEKKRE